MSTKEGVVHLPTGAKPSRLVRDEEEAQRISAMLETPAPKQGKIDWDPNAAPTFEAELELSLDQIRHYDDNPRITENDEYQEIKDSIREKKRLTTPLVVTQRPGDRHYTLAAGGNTRLTILNELWQETNDPTFYKQRVRFWPWNSELDVLVDHHIENNKRGNPKFWDNANAMTKMKKALESEIGESIGQKRLVRELAERGVNVSKTQVSLYEFAWETLLSLGPAVRLLTRGNVQVLRPKFTPIVTAYKTLSGKADEAIDSDITSAIARYGAIAGAANSFEVDAAITALLEDLAGLLERPVSDLCKAADHIAAAPNEDIPRDTLELVIQATAEPPRPPTPSEETTAPPRSAKRPSRRIGVDRSEHPTSQEQAPKQDASPRPAPQTAEQARWSVLRCAESLSTLAGIQESVRPIPDRADSHGYYMEPINIPDGPSRWVWWFLAAQSLQFVPEFSETLPESCLARQAMSEDENTSNRMLEMVGPPPTTEALWSVGFWGDIIPPEAQTQCVEILQAILELRRREPQMKWWPDMLSAEGSGNGSS